MHFRKHYFSKLVFGGVVIIVDGDDVVLSHLFLNDLVPLEKLSRLPVSSLMLMQRGRVN